MIDNNDTVVGSGDGAYVHDIIHGAILLSQIRPLEMIALRQHDEAPPGLVSHPVPPHSPH